MAVLAMFAVDVPLVVGKAFVSVVLAQVKPYSCWPSGGAAMARVPHRPRMTLPRPTGL